MTHDEYRQLLQHSELFQSLPKDGQKRMLEAQGAERDQFIQSIKDSDQFLDGAKREMVEKNEKAVKNFQAEMKTLRKDKRVADEARTTKKEQAAGQKLLEELDNL